MHICGVTYRGSVEAARADGATRESSGKDRDTSLDETDNHQQNVACRLHTVHMPSPSSTGTFLLTRPDDPRRNADPTEPDPIVESVSTRQFSQLLGL